MVADAARVAHAGGGEDDLGRRVAVDGHRFLFRFADVQTRELQGVLAALHQGEGFVVVALGKVFPEDRGGFARQRAVHKDREVFVALDTALGLDLAGHRFLIDCGMEQGRDVYENADLPCAPGTYEALLLTHAHIDHSGRIPYLYKNGYRGPIYTTDATRDLCAIMLEDSAHIQELEAEWKNRKAMRSGAEMIEPDYTVEDAQNVMKQFVPCPYETWQTLFDGPTGKIEMRFTDVGHLLGSASVSLRIAEPGRTPEIIVFSGDIGNTHQPPLSNVDCSTALKSPI